MRCQVGNWIYESGIPEGDWGLLRWKGKLLKAQIKLLLSLLVGVGREAMMENGIGSFRRVKNNSRSHYRVWYRNAAEQFQKWLFRRRVVYLGLDIDMRADRLHA